MRIGYLHIISPTEVQSGVTRYGQLLAQEIYQQREVQVIEAELQWCPSQSLEKHQLSLAAEKLYDCNCVHIQYSKYLWGPAWLQWKRLQILSKRLHCPIITTLHDIYQDTYDPRAIPYLWELWKEEYWKPWRRGSIPFKTICRTFWETYLSAYLADQLTMLWLLNHTIVVACNKTEVFNIKHFWGADKVNIIPHFIEKSLTNFSQTEAKQKLKLQNHRILTLQGFIYPRKGHELLLKTLVSLPEDIKVFFAGGAAPGQQEFLQELEQLIQQLALSERVIITGYLSRHDLELYLTASDLGICPFEIISASGSLATWISLGRPILATSLPQIDEINSFSPDSIQIFTSYTVDAFRTAILQALNANESISKQLKALDFLKKKFAIETIAKQYTSLYKSKNRGFTKIFTEDLLSKV